MGTGRKGRSAERSKSCRVKYSSDDDEGMNEAREGSTFKLKSIVLSRCIDKDSDFFLPLDPSFMRGKLISLKKTMVVDG